MSGDSDAFYAILAFVGAALLLAADKAWDRHQTRQERQRVGWAELFNVGSEIKRSIERVMGEPHHITEEIETFPADQIFDVTRSFYEQIDTNIAKLYILSAYHPKGELGDAIQRINRAAANWLKISGLARSRRMVEEEKVRKEKGELEALKQQLAHVEEKLKKMGE